MSQFYFIEIHEKKKMKYKIHEIKTNHFLNTTLKNIFVIYLRQI
jgi:hypothetical protein